MTTTHSHLTDDAVEQLRSLGYSDSDIEGVNSAAAERGTVVQFICSLATTEQQEVGHG